MDSEIEKEEAQARLDSQGESVSSLASSRDVLEKRAALDAAQEAAGAKTNDILEACKWSDLSKLKALAESTGGFLTDDLRRLACTFTQSSPTGLLFLAIVSKIARRLTMYGRANSAWRFGIFVKREN